jgi:hypothetical protein
MILNCKLGSSCFWRIHTIFICILMLVFSFISCKVVKPNQVVQNKKSVTLGKNYQKLVETLTSFSRGSKGALKTDADEFLSSIEKDYSNYVLDMNVIDSLAAFVNDGMISIDVYGGNWCSDTRYGMGGLLRVLDACEMPAENFRYVRVSKEKKLIDIHVEGLQISKVPLVIVHNKKMEFGKIIEVPNKGIWEMHLLSIINKALNH